MLKEKSKQVGQFVVKWGKIICTALIIGGIINSIPSFISPEWYIQSFCSGIGLTGMVLGILYFHVISKSAIRKNLKGLGKSALQASWIALCWGASIALLSTGSFYFSSWVQRGINLAISAIWITLGVVGVIIISRKTGLPACP
jgi:hypothetical protein